MALWFSRMASKPGISTSISLKPLDQPAQPVLDIAEAVAGHVAGGVQLHLHLVQREPIAASASDVVRPLRLSADISLTSSSSSARTGSIWFSSRPFCKPVDAPFDLGELPLDRRGHLGFAAGSGDLGLTPRFLDLGAPPRFRRFRFATRLGKIGETDRFRLLDDAMPLRRGLLRHAAALLGGLLRLAAELLGGRVSLGATQLFRRLRFGLALRLGRLGLAPCFRDLGLAARLRGLSLPSRFGNIRLPAYLGRLGFAPGLRNLASPPDFGCVGVLLRLRQFGLTARFRELGLTARLDRRGVAPRVGQNGLPPPLLGACLEFAPRLSLGRGQARPLGVLLGLGQKA